MKTVRPLLISLLNSLCTHSTILIEAYHVKLMDLFCTLRVSEKCTYPFSFLSTVFLLATITCLLFSCSDIYHRITILFSFITTLKAPIKGYYMREWSSGHMVDLMDDLNDDGSK